MDVELRALLWARCKGYCERCGFPMIEDRFAAHHRKLRAQGGTDSAVNLLALHHACHNNDTRSVHFTPEQSYANGWMVHSWGDPRTTPVLLAGRRWVRLTEAGTYAYGVECVECFRVWADPASAKICAEDDKDKADKVYNHEEDPWDAT